MKRKSIIAKEGHVLTDGVTYGSEIFLAKGKNPADFREIPWDEYEAKLVQDALTDVDNK